MYDRYLKAAIIGYWRCSHSIELITVITGLFYVEVEKIITEYLQNEAS